MRGECARGRRHAIPAEWPTARRLATRPSRRRGAPTPALRPVAEARVEASHLVRGPAHQPREQTADLRPEHRIGGQTDRVLEPSASRCSYTSGSAKAASPRSKRRDGLATIAGCRDRRTPLAATFPRETARRRATLLARPAGSAVGGRRGIGLGDQDTVLDAAAARHLLRRTGFGARRATSRCWRVARAARRPTSLLDFKPKAFKPRRQGLRDRDAQQVDQVHAEDEDAAAGEAGALLARPLRDRLREGAGRQADGARRTSCFRLQLQGQLQGRSSRR